MTIKYTYPKYRVWLAQGHPDGEPLGFVPIDVYARNANAAEKLALDYGAYCPQAWGGERFFVADIQILHDQPDIDAIVMRAIRVIRE